jgi:hypothetical protein
MRKGSAHSKSNSAPVPFASAFASEAGGALGATCADAAAGGWRAAHSLARHASATSNVLNLSQGPRTPKIGTYFMLTIMAK